MYKKTSVVVGMSGGVDSAVAAALLCEAGYEVVGVTLILWKEEKEDQKRWQDRSCCKVGLARHVAKQLGIPHQTIPVEGLFQKEVIEDFCETYLAGQTPNPCVRCNERIKFAQLLALAQAWGFDYLATGHYAQITRGADGLTLETGLDQAKDQSYFLYRLSQEQLAKTLFPLGARTKEEVYHRARLLGLPYEEVLESQEICFVHQKDYRAFLTEHYPEAHAPGAIVTESGERVGVHAGVAFHTVGQRRGLGVARGERVYVTRLDPVKREVIVGEGSALFKRGLIADQVVWSKRGPLRPPLHLAARVRYRTAPQGASLLTAQADRFQLLFDEPVRGITPGQSVVLYQGDSVVGGGRILESLS